MVVDFIWSDKRYMPIFHRIVNVLGPVPGMYGPSGDEELRNRGRDYTLKMHRHPKTRRAPFHFLARVVGIWKVIA